MNRDIVFYATASASSTFCFTSETDTETEVKTDRQTDRQIDRYLMCYAQSTAKHYITIRAKQNIFIPQVQILIHYLIHIVRIGKKIDRSRDSRHSMQSYIF